MFKYYTKEKSVFEFIDYEVLLQELKLYAPRKVLEFGPGVSTWAFIEAGIPHIDSYEHDQAWLEKAKAEFKAHPQVVFRKYENTPVLDFQPTEKHYGLGFVDAPVGGEARRRLVHPGQENMSRFNTVAFALKHCSVVLLHDAKRPDEQNTLDHFRNKGYEVDMIDTPKGIARIWYAGQ